MPLMVVLETLQILVVLELNVTGSPELAVAGNVADALTARDVGKVVGIVMVCVVSTFLDATPGA